MINLRDQIESELYNRRPYSMSIVNFGKHNCWDSPFYNFIINHASLSYYSPFWFCYNVTSSKIYEEFSDYVSFTKKQKQLYFLTCVV